MSDPGPTLAENRGPDLGNEAGSQAMDQALQSSFTILKLVIAVLVVYLVFSNTSAVEGEKEGVIILRLGQPHVASTNEVWKSGIRFALPYPLEERVKLDREKPIKTEFFKYAPVGRVELGDSLENRPVDASRDGFVVTRDNKILHITATLRYTIINPEQFAFDFAEPEAVLKMALEGAITFAASQRSLDEIRKGRVEFASGIRDRLRILVDRYGLGVGINDVIIGNDDVELPFVTRAARAQLNSAESEAQRIVSEAEKAAENLNQAFAGNQSNTNATGEVATILSKARSEARSIESKVGALRKQFDSIYGGADGEPVRSPADRQLALRRLYNEVMTRIMDNPDMKRYVITERDGVQKIRLLINPKPPAPKESPFDNLRGNQAQPGGQ